MVILPSRVLLSSFVRASGLLEQAISHLVQPKPVSFLPNLTSYRAVQAQIIHTASPVIHAWMQTSKSALAPV